LSVHRLSWWLEWPAGLIRVGVVFLVVVAALAVVVRYPAVLRELGREASNSSSLSYADREVAGGNGLVDDQAALYEARGRIPENETYHVAVGADYEGGSDLTVPYVESYYQYFLMPRRPADKAPWLICYGCDLQQYGSRAEVVWESAEGISIARIRR
jgi:hypothetical protein